jgi:hypothetical protein
MASFGVADFRKVKRKDVLARDESFVIALITYDSSSPFKHELFVEQETPNWSSLITANSASIFGIQTFIF